MKNLNIAFFGGSHVHSKISLKCKKLGANCYLLDKSKDCFANSNSDFVNIDFNNKKMINFIKKKKLIIYIHLNRMQECLPWAI